MIKLCKNTTFQKVTNKTVCTNDVFVHILKKDTGGQIF